MDLHIVTDTVHIKAFKIAVNFCITSKNAYIGGIYEERPHFGFIDGLK